MLFLRVFVSEKRRHKMITAYVILSSACFFLSCLELSIGLESIDLFHAALSALDKNDEKILAYVLIVGGMTGANVNFVCTAVVFSQYYPAQRTLGCTQMMTLLTVVKMLVFFLDVLTVIGHLGASSPLPLIDPTDGFKRAMLKYSTDLDYKMAVDETQYRLKCCGNEGPKDWLKIHWYGNLYSTKKKDKNVPFSCCNPKSENPCRHDDVLTELEWFSRTHNESNLTVYRRGCLDAFYDLYIFFNTYFVCIPGFFKAVAYFYLIVVLRYLDTSIYRAIKTGFPQKDEFGYLLAFYERYQAPKKPASLGSKSALVGSQSTSPSKNQSLTEDSFLADNLQ